MLEWIVGRSFIRGMRLEEEFSCHSENLQRRERVWDSGAGMARVLQLIHTPIARSILIIYRCFEFPYLIISSDNKKFEFDLLHLFL